MEKRILLISSRSDIGGGPQHVRDLIHGCKRIGARVFVASPKIAPYGKIFQELSDGHFEIPHRKLSFIRLLKLAKFIKANQIQIIHSHGRGAGAYSRLLSVLDVKVFHSFHGFHHSKTLLGKLKNFIDRLLSYRTDRLFFVSTSEYQTALKYNIHIEEKSKVIPNGLQLSPPTKEAKKGEFKSIGILSRFDPHKNILRSLELFAELLKHSPLVHLNIAGDGEQKEEIEEKVKSLNIVNNVTFYGFTSEPLSFLKEQDVYLSTSLGEGLPYTALQAMSVNTIPLVSHVSGHIDILDAPYLFNLDDRHDFINKFNNLQSGIQHHFQAQLEKDYDINKQIKKVVDTYYEN